MSQPAQYETLELELRTPATGIRVAALSGTLEAVDRLYALASLVGQPDYRDQLAARCRFPAGQVNHVAARHAPCPPSFDILGDTLADQDRLRLAERSRGDTRRYSLVGLAATIHDLRDYLAALSGRWRSPDAGRGSKTEPDRVVREYEDRLTRQVQNLDVGPWFRGYLLELLNTTLEMVASATSMLQSPAVDAAEDEIADDEAAA